jgi:hypothetical protein
LAVPPNSAMLTNALFPGLEAFMNLWDLNVRLERWLCGTRMSEQGTGLATRRSPHFERCKAEAAKALTSAEFERGWTLGQELPYAAAVAVA